MMVKIRLRRVGAKKQPSYRVVVTDSRSPRDGRFIEVIGFHNPRTKPETMEIKEDRALHWLNVGAQPTDAVARLLKKLGTMARFERLKQGEPLEELLAEAEEAAQARPAINPKTRRDHTMPVTEEPPAEPEPKTAEAKKEAEEEETGEPVEAEEGKEQVEETEE
ncbi:MAG: 30S ribosomal protein S16 [Chloroflexi bacterium]|nr:30S ribosomal protein S16 [Chloroflexota bacterium]